MAKKEVLHIYTRVSTGIQEDEGTSLDTQLEEGIKRANKLGMKHKLWNEGGQSGSKDDLSNRPLLLSILNEIDRGEIKHLYVWNTDRLSRNLNTWGMIRLKLIQQDITLHTPTGKQQLSDPQTNLMIGIMSEFSQYENQLRTERFRVGKLYNVRKGKWKGGPPPYGYDLENGYLEPNIEEERWVNKMFEWYLKGLSLPKIKFKLLDKGVMSRRGLSVWSERSIHNILITNTHYQGYWTFTDGKTDETIRVECPPIVDADIVFNVKELYEKRKFKTGKHIKSAIKYDYLLKELFECGSCGGAFHGWKSPSQKQRPYYSCNAKRNQSREVRKKEIKGIQKVVCKLERNLNMDNADEMVWETVISTIQNSNLFKESIKQEMLDDNSIVKTKEHIKKIEKRLKQNEQLMQRISESIVNQETDKLIGIRSKKEIDDVLMRLDAELLKLKVKKKEMTLDISSRNQNSKWIDWVNEWGNRIEEMSNSDFKFEDKKEFLKSIIDKIVVNSVDNLEHEVDIRFKLPYVNDEFVYKDNGDKSGGYILKDGSYSKKLRIRMLKKTLN
jgi:DNA invertase Pin-like site-specific DNA recombinase